MSNRNSLNINNSIISPNLNKNSKVLSLEIYCLDYILLKFDLFNIEQQKRFLNDDIIKEKLLQRMLNLYQNKFTIKNQPTPQATFERVEQLINYRATTSLDFSSINLNKFNSNKSTSPPPFEFLSNCQGITSFTMSGFSSITSERILPLLKLIGRNLKRLDISRNPRLNDSIINYISLYCPNLMYLNMEDCIGIQGAIFQRAVFMNKFENLIELNLSGCKSINSKNLYCLKTTFPSLKMFSFAKNFLSDEDGSLLVQTLPSTLISLDLSFNPIGRSTLLSLVPNNNTNLTSFYLKSLSLGYCRCINAFDLSAVLAGLYKSLEYLSIPGCFQIDKSFLDQLLLSPQTILSNLASASITQANLNNITNTTATASTISIPNINNNKRKSTSVAALNTLDISNCSQFLSSSTLLTINQNCKQMKILRYNTIGFNHNHIYSSLH